MSGDNCPSCGVDLRGEPIPQEYLDAGYYGPSTTHYRRNIGVEVPGVYDGVLYWQCPDCGRAWVRNFGDYDRLNTLSAEYVERHNKEVGP